MSRSVAGPIPCGIMMLSPPGISEGINECARNDRNGGAINDGAKNNRTAEAIKKTNSATDAGRQKGELGSGRWCKLAGRINGDKNNPKYNSMPQLLQLTKIIAIRICFGWVIKAQRRSVRTLLVGGLPVIFCQSRNAARNTMHTIKGKIARIIERP